MTISRATDGTGDLKWTNRAGVVWTLTPNTDCSALAVHTDCAYHAQGHTQCRVATEDGTKVS